MSDKSNKAQKNYKVGKGRPPVETRWKPGQSGNPRGRRKGRRNLESMFFGELHRRVVVVENGKRRKITKGEATMKQLINAAMKGDPRAIQTMINIIKMMGDQKLPATEQQPVVRRKRFTLSIFEKDLAGRRFQIDPKTNKRITGKPVDFDDDDSSESEDPTAASEDPTAS